MLSIHGFEEFSSIIEEVVIMGEKTSFAIENAVKALILNDAILADNSRRVEKEVDNCLSLIEENCLNILSTRQFNKPQVTLLVNSLRIAVELERICDYGNQIAKIVQKKLSKQEAGAISALHETVSQMGCTTVKMLNDVLDSYKRLEFQTITDIKNEDKIVNKSNKKVFRDIVCILSVNPWVQEAFLDYHTAVRYIERVGDRAVNIARLIHDITIAKAG